MNLKFEEVCWTKDSELIYVLFRVDGQHMEWYPRWDDLRQLIQAAIIAEGHPNNWQSPELDKFKATFGEMTELIDVSRSLA
jgi:hypothetical protein